MLFLPCSFSQLNLEWKDEIINENISKFEGKIGGRDILDPVSDGSLTDSTFNVKRQVSIQEINTTFKTASQTNFKGILDYTEDPIVSVDIIGNTNS